MLSSRESLNARLRWPSVQWLMTGPGPQAIVGGFFCGPSMPNALRRKGCTGFGTARRILPPRESTMKEGIHPNYREVLFSDLSNGFKFVTRSCANTKETETFEGKEYPLYKLDTSSESHPFYTGTQKSVDNMGGRVERFRNRFGKTAAK